MAGELLVRELGCRGYQQVWQAMQCFTDQRDREAECDELWFVSHPPVFTQGQSGKAEHLLAPGDIPVVQVDRGGQVTYHGPGQLVGYTLINLKQRGLGVRELVTTIESSIVEALATWGIDAAPDRAAPGVYVDGRKIASLGLRIRRSCSFHGFAVNIDVNKEHFSRINPCGYAGLEICNLRELLPEEQCSSTLTVRLQERILGSLADALGYSTVRKGETELPDFQQSSDG